MSAVCLSDLLTSLVFAALVILFSTPERLRRRLDGSFVLLLTAENTAQPSHRLRFKVRPLRSREGHCKFA